MMICMTNVSVSAAVEALVGADVATADTARCVDLLRQVRVTRGWLDAVEAKVGTRMRELAAVPAGASGLAEVHGSVGGVSAAEGRRKERRSKAIDDAPSFGDALESGRIGAEHVDVLANVTATVADEVKAELLAAEAALLDAAVSKTPEQFARTCRDRIRRIERDQGISRNRQQRRETFVSRKLNAATGMIEGRYAFHPELGNQIFNAIDKEVAAMIAEGVRAGDPEFVGRTVDRNRLAAEAIGRLLAAGHARIRPLEADISMLIDAEVAATGRLHDGCVCETADGLPVPPETIRRLICYGRITPVILGQDGVPINVGRTLRHANRAQRRSLRAIYRTCAFDGCDMAFDRCEIHHVDRFELGGPTDLSNLLPLCSRHHHLVHEGGWRLRLTPDRTLTITCPDGSAHATARPDITTEREDRRERHRRRPPAA
jgi:hypothetical protein